MGDTGGCTFQIRLGHGLQVLWHWINNSSVWYNSQFSPQLWVTVGAKINNCGTKTERGVLNGALVRLQVQLCVFPLLQDPVELLREGVVERRHTLGVGLPQQHVAVPIHLPQHAGQSGWQPVGVVHVGQWRRHGKRRGWGRCFGWRKLALTWNYLEEAITDVPEGWHRDGPTTLAAIAVAGDGLKFKMGAPLSLRGPQDLQPLLGELSVPRGLSGAEAHIKQHHSQHQAKPS